MLPRQAARARGRAVWPVRANSFLTPRQAQSIVGTLDKSWERRLTSMETVVLGVPQCVPEAYARLPKTLAAATMPHTSPLFDVKGCKERWCFVEVRDQRALKSRGEVALC